MESQLSSPDKKNVERMQIILLYSGSIYYILNIILYTAKGISIISKDPKTMLVISSTFMLVLIFAGILLLRFYNKQFKSSSLPIWLRKWFITLFVTMNVLNAVFICFLVGKILDQKDNINYNHSKTRIVLLLPLNESLKSAYEDGIRQIIGFAEFLKSNPECTKKFEFALYDHSMTSDNAKRIIQKELSEGTEYFVCTMSNVTVPLSKAFPQLIKENIISRKGFYPKLICAVTSAPVKLEEGSVYRYYIRSQEEASELANIGKLNDIKTVTFIAVEDDYGKGAVKEFKEKWTGSITEGVYVPKTATLDEIEYLIKMKVLRIPKDQREGIFICHYGGGLDNIISALHNEGIKAKLLATSTLSIFDWQKPVESILDTTEWFTCIPDYKYTVTNQNDVIKNFTTFVLDRLILSINNINDTNDFNYCWKNATYPDNLETRLEGIDIIVPMKGVYKNEVNQKPL
jgi:hypothetical protein